MSVVGSRDTWPVQNQETRMKKGPLIRVQKGPGHWVKMHQSDAEELGLIPAKSAPKVQDKQVQGPPQHKMMLPEEDKVVETHEDDFTTIPNIGQATARALNAHGIFTFDQLRSAGHLEYISIRAMDSIEEWRQNG